MINNKNLFLAVFLASIFTGASYSFPLANPYTARSVGSEKWDLSAAGYAYGPWFYGLSAATDYGFSDNWDVGVALGRNSYGLFGFDFHQDAIEATTKYAFINNKEGFSAAAIGGLGYTKMEDFSFWGTKISSSGSMYYYAGPVVSYKFTSFEPYALAKLTGNTRVQRNSDTDNGPIVEGEIGVNYWILPDHLAVNFALGAMSFLSGDSGAGGKIGLGIAYRF